MNKDLMEARHALLIICADQTGLVHKITGVLYRRQLNVIENAETVDRSSNTFFMRTEFIGDFAPSDLLNEIKKLLPTGAQVEIKSLGRKKLILLATKEAHCLGDLLLRQASGDLIAEIQCVISQYSHLAELTQRFSVPFHHIPVPSGDDRAAHENLLMEKIKTYQPDYLVLAKYMRILSPDFTDAFAGRILNIHHSFLPAFVGANPYKQAFDRGVKIIGATAHLVSPDLDEGPIITQSVIPVNHGHGPVEMAKAGRDVEQLVLAKALKLVLASRVLVQGRRTVVFE